MTERPPSNWNRWGSDDQLGTANLMTPERIRLAANLIRTGKAYSLAAPLETRGAMWPPRHKPWRSTVFGSSAEGRSSAGDQLVLHSHSGTHIDALCHVWYDDRLYNGFDATEHVSSYGVTRNSIDNLLLLAGRGVLLDVAGWKGVEHLEAGDAITGDDLTACSEAQGVDVGAGDIVLVRTGWLRVMSHDRARYDSGEPGLDTSTLAWLHERDVTAVGVDNYGVEVIGTMPPDDLPVHRIGIRDLGLYLMENLDLEELAADRAYESFVVIAPLRLTGGAGSPINPIAIT